MSLRTRIVLLMLSLAVASGTVCSAYLWKNLASVLASAVWGA